MTRPRRHEPDDAPAGQDPPTPAGQQERLRPGHRGSAERVRQAIAAHATRPQQLHDGQG